MENISVVPLGLFIMLVVTAVVTILKCIKSLKNVFFLHNYDNNNYHNYIISVTR